MKWFRQHRWYLIYAGLIVVRLHSQTVLTVACGSATDTGYSGSSYAWTATNQPELSSQLTPYNALRASNGGPFSYTLSPPFGPYWVTLRFIEPNKTAAGQRRFSVSVNDSVVLTSVDVFVLAGGAMKTLEITLPHVYISPLKITFTPIQGNALVSGIKVVGNVP